MRIALFSWEARHAITIGGVSIHVTELAAALTRLGHSVHIFTRRGQQQALYDFVFGVHLHRCPWSPQADLFAEIESFAVSATHYATNAENTHGHFELIHAYDWLGFLAAESFLRGRETPLAITFQTTEWGRSEAWPTGGDALRIAEIEKRATKKARAIIAVSHTVRRELDWLYQVPDWKTGIVYYGVDPAPFRTEPFAPGEVKERYGIDPLAPTILFVGRLHPNKGAARLLQAFAQVRETTRNAHCIFVGTGELHEQLAREAEQLGLAGIAHFPGWLPGQDLIALYRACDVVVCPSRKDPFGVIVLAAWAAGKPVVASKAGAPGEFIKHEMNGLLVEPEPDELAAALLALFADFDGLRWMGANGRTTVDTAFTWDAVAKATLEVYARKEKIG